MDYLSSTNATVFQHPVWKAHLATDYALIAKQQPFTMSLVSLLTCLASFFAYQLYRPSIHPLAPKFTSDTYPILGSIGLVTRPWSFWQGAVRESNTGNFSFWQGKRHIVGISGEKARKMFFEHPNLCFINGQSLLAFGLHFWPPVHEIFHPSGDRARNNTFFLRTLLGLLKTKRLERALPGAMEDARDFFKSLFSINASGVVNSPEIWRIVFKQNTRLFFADDFANDPVLFEKTSGYLDVLLHSYSPFYAFCHWIPEPSMIRRRLARYGLIRVLRNLYNQRTKFGSVYKDDALQMMIDNNDPYTYIEEFCVSAAFITTTNAHIIVAQMINTMAVHPSWQEKVYREIVSAADRYSQDKSLPLVEKLRLIPIKGWETEFPSLELCLYEVIRVWTSFAAGRLNVGTEPIPIPESNEVIPVGSFAIYNTTDINFNEKLFPDPAKFDPLRFTEGRQEYKKETHGWFGWGVGMHPCAGQRWAKIQQSIIIAHALALYKWTSCDENGKPDPYSAQRQRLDTELNSDTKFKLPPAYCKMERRE